MRDRACAAWEWVKEQVSAKVAKSGAAAGDWWKNAKEYCYLL
jgi:hypothetical protein